MSINSDVQLLRPGNRIRLFELDATGIGGDIFRFHGHQQMGPIIWQGNPYQPIGIEAKGLEVSTSKTVAPTLRVANVLNGVQGGISALCRILKDLVGAKLTIHETFRHFLDSANFPDGQNPTEANEENQTVWYVEQKTSMTWQEVIFELSSPVDFRDQQIPAAQIEAHCLWARWDEYQGDHCGYTGSDMFDTDDQPTDNPELDKCGGRLNSCKIRFKDQPLRFGGCPAAGMIRMG